MISEKEWRWVKRMQKAGLFPPDPVPLAPPPPEGQWSITSMPDGQVFVQVNNRPMLLLNAIEIIKVVERSDG